MEMIEISRNCWIIECLRVELRKSRPHAFSLRLPYVSMKTTYYKINCSIPDVCIDERRLPLFIARATLRGLIAVLEARATGDAAR